MSPGSTPGLSFSASAKPRHGSPPSRMHPVRSSRRSGGVTENTGSRIWGRLYRPYCNRWTARAEQPESHSHGPPLADIRGEEATQRIKADPATKCIPVLALTANAMAGDKEKALAAGCEDFDTKPVEMSLLKKIKETSLNALERRDVLLHLLRTGSGTTRKRLAARINSANWGEADSNAAAR